VKKQLIGAAALLLLSACGQEPATEAVVEEAPAPSSGVIHENMDLSVNPGEDFFSYVNGQWVANTEIPADRSDYGTFGVLRDEAQENVKVIIETTASGDFTPGSDEQLVGDLYRSYMDMEARNAKGVSPLLPELERIAAIASHGELAVHFASANRRGFNMPFELGQNEDMKSPQFYMMYTWQGGLGLPDREYYFNDDEKSIEVRAKYVEHIEKMFDLAGFADGAAAASTIMALETRMAEAQMKKEQTRDFASNYSKVPLEELGEIMPRFN